MIFIIITFGLIGFLLTGCGKMKQMTHHSGPHPQTINFSVIPDKNIYNPGDQVKLTVSIKNVMNKSFEFTNESHVLVGSIMDSPNKYNSIPLSAFKNQTLKPNQTIKQTVIWNQNGRTGWCQALVIIDSNYGEASGGSQFFVNNPNVLLGTIEPNATINNVPSDLTNHNATLIIKRIEFSKQYTKVYYDVKTDKKMAMYFQMSLNRSNGENDPETLDVQRKNTSYGITGFFSFNPTLKSVDQLSVLISKWEFDTSKGDISIHGNWKKSISIKDVK
jgi:hypothetical protein